MTTIYLLLGSNLGDRSGLLAQATAYLAQAIGPVQHHSSLYETAPWGVTDQPAFLNQVLCFQTTLSPEGLLGATQEVETLLQRTRHQKWGARTIDVDILYYGSDCIQTATLSVPHPHLHERRFTMVPLVEIAPEFVHPRLQLTNLQLLEQCEDTGEVVKV